MSRKNFNPVSVDSIVALKNVMFVYGFKPLFTENHKKVPCIEKQSFIIKLLKSNELWEDDGKI